MENVPESNIEHNIAVLKIFDALLNLVRTAQLGANLEHQR